MSPLASGQPVYFVAFRPMPEPGQTIADVAAAEAAFVRLVRERHPDSPKPCPDRQLPGRLGGGAPRRDPPGSDRSDRALRCPDVLLVGHRRAGSAPLRRRGLGGGALPALLLSDLGGGLFDGAHLVENFEKLNPGRTRFRKYVDLYANIDTAERRFLEFERWWGGLHLMNGEEMRWIVENLFVGNRLAAGRAELEPGRPIDLRAIQAPIVVFASRGDNITPPPQALNWIVDAYADESEIEVRGQRIVYTVHEEVGHLGIFVSGSVATREHTEIASILDTIEALPPGLYELGIEDVVGEGQDKRFRVSFARRTLADVRAFDDERLDERAFAAVARASEALTELYESTARPLVQAAITPTTAALGRAMHPMRLRRSAFASTNPFMSWVPAAADAVREERRAVDDSNPFRVAELAWAEWIEAGFDRMRDARELATEAAFFTLWANPLAAWYGAPRAAGRKPPPPGDLRDLPEVRVALERIEKGGYAEALVRMLVLIAATRAGGVRRSRLERSFSVLTTGEPFASMDTAARAHLIHEQSLIARFAPEEAFATLPTLLASKRERNARAEAGRVGGRGHPRDGGLDAAASRGTSRAAGVLERPPTLPPPAALSFFCRRARVPSARPERSGRVETLPPVFEDPRR